MCCTWRSRISRARVTLASALSASPRISAAAAIGASGLRSSCASMARNSSLRRPASASSATRSASSRWLCCSAASARPRSRKWPSCTPIVRTTWSSASSGSSTSRLKNSITPSTPPSSLDREAEARVEPHAGGHGSTREVRVAHDVGDPGGLARRPHPARQADAASRTSASGCRPGTRPRPRPAGTRRRDSAARRSARSTPQSAPTSHSRFSQTARSISLPTSGRGVGAASRLAAACTAARWRSERQRSSASAPSTRPVSASTEV